ncbi:hypothetical protein [Streptomyces beijiangensis]|uniref:Uncharacterized protein n=1 Tax=Streptomyces beijiangensis TaxID=163361 RepID=A0A939FH08_9ACTN|nr:hypothetical protein [Streptomyces beijiangensis]MBO0517257.1 hypothetical protein [Streptomyces beijiangensis]
MLDLLGGDDRLTVANPQGIGNQGRVHAGPGRDKIDVTSGRNSPANTGMVNGGLDADTITGPDPDHSGGEFAPSNSNFRVGNAGTVNG